MNYIIKIIFYFVSFVIFPGFLFTAAMGLISIFIDRKLSARLQWRVGPPWYQPFADILKLLGKEIIIPERVSEWLFVSVPLLGLAGATLASTILWTLNINPRSGFVGDLIVIIYLLLLPSLSIILAGLSSRNPFAVIGASREMKLILAYELPFIIAIFTPVLKVGSILISDIIKYQAATSALIFSPSCFLAFFVALLCCQAKLAFSPFDIPEAEQEIMGGPLVEYSGPLLAVFKLTKAMLLFILPTFLITLFMSGGNVMSIFGPIIFIIKYLFVLLLIILIKNTNPRLRIDQALKFFWVGAGGLAVLSLILAYMGA